MISKDYLYNICQKCTNGANKCFYKAGDLHCPEYNKIKADLTLLDQLAPKLDAKIKELKTKIFVNEMAKDDYKNGLLRNEVAFLSELKYKIEEQIEKDEE